MKSSTSLLNKPHTHDLNSGFNVATEESKGDQGLFSHVSLVSFTPISQPKGEIHHKQKSNIILFQEKLKNMGTAHREEAKVEVN